MSDVILPHGGFDQLKGFQIARLVFDLTVRFVELYIDKRSRTCHQMVQAARSGVQNIAEGSVAGGTSKKMELKLTNIARASLVELQLDYEDFLRQRGLSAWSPEHPALLELKKRRIRSFGEFRDWVAWAKKCELIGVYRNASPQAVLVANGALTLLNLALYFLERQVWRLAKDFEKDGGFTERLYRIRKTRTNTD